MSQSRTIKAKVILNALNEGLIEMPFYSMYAAQAYAYSLRAQGYLCEVWVAVPAPL